MQPSGMYVLGLGHCIGSCCMRLLFCLLLGCPLSLINPRFSHNYEPGTRHQDTSLRGAGQECKETKLEVSTGSLSTKGGNHKQEYCPQEHGPKCKIGPQAEDIMRRAGLKRAALQAVAERTGVRGTRGALRVPVTQLLGEDQRLTWQQLQPHQENLCPYLQSQSRLKVNRPRTAGPAVLQPASNYSEGGDSKCCFQVRNPSPR